MTGTDPLEPALMLEPPPPDWLAPSTSTRVVEFDDPLPSPPGAPPSPPRRRRLVVAALTAAVGLAAGAIAGTALRSNGSRPSLTESSVPSSTSTPSPASSAAGSPTTDPTQSAPSTVVPPSTTPAGGSPSSTASPSTDAIAAAVDPGIVDINTVLDFGAGSAAGTGMILTSTGEILTNNHVIEGATTISVVVPSIGKTFTASVVGTDPTQDVAVLQLKDATNLTPIPLGDSSNVSAGDLVVALGNAGGRGGTPDVVTGSVLATDQTITASDPGGANSETLSGLIQINAPIQPGDSGGPLVNASGKVIGMNTAASGGRRFRATGAVGFAIPINQALSIAKDIEAGQASSIIHIGLPAFLGVTIDSTATNPSGVTGAQITGVQPGKPAATAGLVAGDTITSIGGQPVSSPDDLSLRIKSHHPGDKVIVLWTDQNGKQHSASVVLTTGPAD